jgi:hypothetical protein
LLKFECAKIRGRRERHKKQDIRKKAQETWYK